MYRPGQTFQMSLTPLSGLQEHSRWFGKVIACNVVHTGMDKNETQTTLLLEPFAPNPGYR